MSSLFDARYCHPLIYTPFGGLQSRGACRSAQHQLSGWSHRGTIAAIHERPTTTPSVHYPSEGQKPFARSSSSIEVLIGGESVEQNAFQPPSRDVDVAQRVHEKRDLQPCDEVSD